ncbi:MAG: ATP-binding cassette domain-containing protein [Gammaproteobacteria bacterium]|nr:ATP-binding cassette domain-containing protein [Gammaproteobacteria bacterium]MYK42813.1 ATP-binding cassette domain-containing protein [Gammaproteobacteria bacterium]
MVGRNGVGKTTIFRLLQGQLRPEEGDIEQPRRWKTASLIQNLPPSDLTALEFVMQGDRELFVLKQQIEQAQATGNNDRLAQTITEFDNCGGFQLETNAKAVLAGLGIASEEFHNPHRAFSGGWRIRLNLAQTLMAPSDLLLLDEPTNHLDLEATSWLRRWLSKYSGTVLTIAHDREFLDSLADQIVHVQQGKAYTYKGGYTNFEKQRVETLVHQQALETRQQQERARIQRFIDRFRAKDSKAKQVQSRIKLLERMAPISILREQSPYQCDFSAPKRFDQPMVSFDDCSLGYGDKLVIESFTQRIYPGDRIGVLGINGSGKTTLLKALVQFLAPLTGSVKLSKHSTVGYFAQHQIEQLNLAQNSLQHLQDASQLSTQESRNLLGAWGFRGDDILRPIEQLSGGERARLVLATISLNDNAILVLDEPTNHLDIEMRDALANALNDFGGAVVIVAHDRHLLTECVNDFWLIRDKKVSDYEGDLEDYEKDLVRFPSDAKPNRMDSQKSRRKERANQRHRDASSRKELVVIEQRLEVLTQTKLNLQAKFTDKTTVQSAARDELNRWLAEFDQTSREIEKLEEQWYGIMQKLDS